MFVCGATAAAQAPLRARIAKQRKSTTPASTSTIKQIPIPPKQNSRGPSHAARTVGNLSRFDRNQGGGEESFL